MNGRWDGQKRQYTAEQLAKFGHVSHREPLCEVLPGEASSGPVQGVESGIGPVLDERRRTKEKAG